MQVQANDGWRITHEHMHLRVGGVEMYVDLGAEPLIAAEKDDQKIAVEVKSFVNVSDIHEFHSYRSVPKLSAGAFYS